MITFAAVLDFLINAWNRSREIVVELFSQSSVIFYVILLVLMNIAQWLYSAYLISRNSGQMALRYNVDFGFDNYVPSWHLYFFPLISLIVILLNLLILALLSRHKDRRFINHLLLAPLTAANILFFAYFINIGFVNSR